MAVQENKSFVWTHKIIIEYDYGWLREEQERIISRILEIFPCDSFHFIEKYTSQCETIDSDGKIRVWRTANQKAKAWISKYFEVQIGGAARIQPVLPATAWIQPVIGATANIALGPQITGTGTIIQPPNKIEGNARISPTIGANASVYPGITATARIPWERWAPPIRGDAKVVYRREKVICGNGRVVIGEHVIDDAQSGTRIGRLRGCDLKGDLPLTGWRLARDGDIEHIIRYVRGTRIDRWVPKVTQFEIWFNPATGDTDGDLMKQAITNLLSYYYAGHRKAYYVSGHVFKVEGDYTNQFHEGVEVRVDSPEYCCRVYQNDMQELAYFKWLIEQYPYQVALAKIIESTTLKANAKIEGDVHFGTVVSSTFDGTYTIVEMSGDGIKDSECLMVHWRESYDSIDVEKSYYPFSANARIQAYLRSTGRIFWLLGPPDSPGNEEDYAYLILEVGE